MSDHQSVDALLIDPNPEDVELFLDALEDQKIANQIHTVPDGDEALDYLHQRGDYTDVSRPDLILLEVNLPEMDGHELLETLNNDPKLAGIPVIVLSESDSSETIAKSYNLHANAYVQKPIDPDEFIDTVRTVGEFWIEIVRLPPDETDDEDELI